MYSIKYSYGTSEAVTNWYRQPVALAVILLEGTSKQVMGTVTTVVTRRKQKEE